MLQIVVVEEKPVLIEAGELVRAERIASLASDVRKIGVEAAFTLFTTDKAAEILSFTERCREQCIVCINVGSQTGLEVAFHLLRRKVPVLMHRWPICSKFLLELEDRGVDTKEIEVIEGQETNFGICFLCQASGWAVCNEINFDITAILVNIMIPLVLSGKD